MYVKRGFRYSGFEFVVKPYTCICISLIPMFIGSLHLKSHCGIYASDPDAYDTFSDVFYPAILDYHKVDKLYHPKPDFGDLNNLGFGDLDPKNEFINSTRIRVGRTHSNYGFPPTTTKEV